MTITRPGVAFATFLITISAMAVAAPADAASSRQQAMAAGHPAKISGSKPPGYRSARYHGGEGSTWRSGRDAHGFQGNYGGCRYFGNAGPGGFKLDRVCR